MLHIASIAQERQCACPANFSSTTRCDHLVVISLDKRGHIFRDGGVVLAAASAFLYCASTAYYHGYYVPFGLDADLLDRNIQQILYHGFIQSLVPSFYVVSIVIFLRVVFVHMALPELNAFLRRNWQRKRKLIKLKQRFWGRRKDTKIEFAQKKSTAVIVMWAFCFLVFILTLARFEIEGKERALAVIGKIESKSIEDFEMVTVQINDKMQKLVYLTCGARNCAGIKPDTMTVYYFPQDGHSYSLPRKNGAKPLAKNGETPRSVGDLNNPSSGPTAKNAAGR